MPGLLNYPAQPGLLGNMGQALMDYGTRQGPFAAQQGMSQQAAFSPGEDQQEVQEYEEAVRRGYRGSFDEFKQQKRARQAMMGQGQSGANGFSVLARALGSGGY